MSMFRSAAELSSSDSDSSGDESDHEVVSTPTFPAGSSSRHLGKGTKSPSLLTRENPGRYSGHATPQDPLDVEPEGHANMMTAALLEFYCLSRAADVLNAQPGSQMRFTRDSPEVQYLGKKMYAYKSQFLSSHGVLPDGIEKDEWGTARQYYRDNLDVLGASALEDLNLQDQSDGGPALGAAGDVILASKTAMNVQLRSEPAAASQQRIRRPKLADIGKRLTSAERIGPLEDFRLNMGSLPTRSLQTPLSNSSPVSFPLFDNPAPSLHLSRYAMEFSEVRILGRGSFGEVYHVKNHIDGQSYAVKKIPLSQRRLEKLQCGGENQLEGIMKEIRTLARLEHTNVVRYYGAWVEQAHVSGFTPHLPEASIEHETETDNSQSKLLGHELTENESFGIVFEDSESTDFGQTKSSLGHGSVFTNRSRRRSSHATVTSRSSKKSSVRSLGEQEDDIESIPRDFNAFSHGQMSTFGATDDIFTDGLSHDPSKLQVQRRTNGSQIPAVVLHIQMSLHPISLSSYLNPQQGEGIRERHIISKRHCFHLMASLRLMLGILCGVDYLHSKRIVHRDLKPANIFLSLSDNKDVDGCPSCQPTECSDKYCHPRIGDFGLVADISHFDDDSPLDENSNLNRIVGTEFYRPPFATNNIGNLNKASHAENVLPDCYKVDETLDVYALGVILFELVYRLNTKMERQMVLSELTRGPHGQSSSPMTTRRPSFPSDFAQKVDMGETPLKDGASVAESLMTCMKGMLEPLSSRRWSCSDVKHHLHDILCSVQKTPNS